MTDRLLKFFEYKHLPDYLQVVSMQFHGLAHGLVENVPQNPERTVALRKLLEAKDCAVRAVIEGVTENEIVRVTGGRGGGPEQA